MCDRQYSHNTEYQSDKPMSNPSSLPHSHTPVPGPGGTALGAECTYSRSAEALEQTRAGAMHGSAVAGQGRGGEKIPHNPAHGTPAHGTPAGPHTRRRATEQRLSCPDIWIITLPEVMRNMSRPSKRGYGATAYRTNCGWVHSPTREGHALRPRHLHCIERPLGERTMRTVVLRRHWASS